MIPETYENEFDRRKRDMERSIRSAGIELNRLRRRLADSVVPKSANQSGERSR